MTAGRPTDYRPEYCDDIVDYLTEGRHIIEYAAKLSVAKSTIYKWAEQHQEFSDALKKAQAKSTAWWLNLHKAKASGIQREGSDLLIIHMLKNKDREEFGDKAEEKKEDSAAARMLEGCSTETLSLIAKDLANGK